MTLPRTSTLADRFPLVARKRPPAKPLGARVARLLGLAESAGRDLDSDKASVVFNGAALVASDCGDSELASEWCRRHARLYLDRAPLDGYTGRFALEPVVNLARLRSRAGDGEGAHRLLTDLYQAIDHRTAACIDGLEIRYDQLPTEPDQRKQIMGWLNEVMLSDGTRALTLAGRWRDALTHVRRYDGIGPALGEGRQVVVIALAMQGNNATAAVLLREATIEQPWEEVVRDLLRNWHAQATGAEPPAGQEELLDRAIEIPSAPGLSVFRTRLCLTTIDLGPDVPPAAIESTVGRLVAEVLRDEDGNAARDLLEHPTVGAAHHAQLRHLVEASGLGSGLVPDAMRESLSSALDLAEMAIDARLSRR